MITIEPHIKNYIDETVDKALTEFDKRAEHYLTLQREIFQDDIKLISESVSGKPGEERVREITKEEIRYARLHR